MTKMEEYEDLYRHLWLLQTVEDRRKNPLAQGPSLTIRKSKATRTAVPTFKSVRSLK